MTPAPVPVCAVDPGPERWAEAGAVIANAARIAIATPLKRVLISIVLRCRVSGAFGRSDREIAARLTRSADRAAHVVAVDTPRFSASRFAFLGREAGWLPLAEMWKLRRASGNAHWLSSRCLHCIADGRSHSPGAVPSFRAGTINSPSPPRLHRRPNFCMSLASERPTRCHNDNVRRAWHR